MKKTYFTNPAHKPRRDFRWMFPRSEVEEIIIESIAEGWSISYRDLRERWEAFQYCNSYNDMYKNGWEKFKEDYKVLAEAISAYESEHGLIRQPIKKLNTSYSEKH